MPQLVVEKGNDRNASIAIAEGDKIIVGRDIGASFRLHDVMTSRKHFMVVGHQGAFYVKDLGSANGTFLNGQRIAAEKPLKLGVGDKIQIGETILSFLDESEGAKKGGLIGKEIAGYRIEERLGRGSMGTVYKATQLSLDRLVALKILAPELLKDKGFIEMFIKEARACGALNHPNIIQVYDVGNFKGIYYFSMEYAETGSIQDRIANNTFLPLPEALSLVTGACEALVYAEKKKLVHRDIKPDNLFVTEDGVVKIGDLGLAHSTAESEKQDGVFGTPHYIAPEQAMNQPIDHRADIYALGGTFYRMVTGYTPYRGANVQEILKKQVKEVPPYAAEKPADLAPEVPWPAIPPFVADIIYKMMAKHPDDRYPSASEILNDLKQAKARLEAASAPPGTSARRMSGYVPAAAPSGRASARAGSAVAGAAAGAEFEGGEAKAPTKRFDFARFQQLDPKQRQLMMIGGAVIGVLAVTLLVVGSLAVLGALSDPAPPPPPSGGPTEIVILPRRPVTNNDSSSGASNPSGTNGNTPISQDPPPTNAGNQPTNAGIEIRAKRQELLARILAEAKQILILHDLSHRTPGELAPIDAAIADLLALDAKYRDDPLLRTDDGPPETTEAGRFAERLRGLRARLDPLHQTFASDYQQVQQVVAEATAARQFGRIFEAFDGYLNKYYSDPDRRRPTAPPAVPISELRDFLDKNADVDYRVEGFPPALDIYRRPDGHAWKLHEQLAGEFLRAAEAMDAAMNQLPGLPDFDARRRALQPHREFFADVVNVWRLNDGLPVAPQRYFNAEARMRLQALTDQLARIDDEEQRSRSDALNRLIVEIRGTLAAADADARRFQFQAAREKFEALQRSQTLEAARAVTDPRMASYEQVIAAKFGQLSRAERFMIGLIDELSRRRVDIPRPEGLTEAGFERVRTVEVVGATPATLQVSRRGGSPLDLPWGSLTGDEFYGLCARVYDIPNLRDADRLMNLGVVLLEVGAPDRAPDIFTAAHNLATGDAKREAREFLAYAILMKAQHLLRNGDGQAAKPLIDRFRREFSDTRAAQWFQTPPIR